MSCHAEILEARFNKDKKDFHYHPSRSCAKNKLCQSLEPFEIKENQQNPPKSTSDKIAEQSTFANLKNMIKETFAFKASASKAILKIILTKTKPPISKKITKQVKVG
ncbi:MAG: hypothetical protein DI529_16260 [Chryseobacterium sp.]|nr:MAG: hypothetical protein DI529_16260 [Chryseobacterium sp.]